MLIYGSHPKNSSSSSNWWLNAVTTLNISQMRRSQCLSCLYQIKEKQARWMRKQCQKKTRFLIFIVSTANVSNKQLASTVNTSLYHTRSHIHTNRKLCHNSFTAKWAGAHTKEGEFDINEHCSNLHWLVASFFLFSSLYAIVYCVYKIVYVTKPRVFKHFIRILVLKEQQRENEKNLWEKSCVAVCCVIEIANSGLFGSFNH